MIVVTLEADPDIGPLLKHASQAPHFWNDTTTELATECRYMPDIEAPGLLVDLKKTANANPSAFAADAYRRAYDVQMAHYLLGHMNRYQTTEIPRVGFIAYEWAEDPDCGLYWLPSEWLEEGLRRREIAMRRLQQWQASFDRRSYPEQTLPLPRFAGVDTIATLDPEHF